MLYPNGKYYVEVKVKRYSLHTIYDIKLREREPPKSSETQYQVLNETKIRKNQKF